jgi:hypothetical protein
MAAKQKCLDLNMKLEVTCLCEFSSSSKVKQEDSMDYHLDIVNHFKEQWQNMIGCSVRWKCSYSNHGDHGVYNKPVT